ncbi:MAG: Lrp/AsnC family transcriptional regulator [Oscillospiraceae bacterium]
MNEVLRLLEQDGRYNAGQIAAMTGSDTAEVEKLIAQYEADGIILGYSAIVDWDKTSDENVTALIEVKISPQRGDGYDRIAERIFQYEEVESLYLMSGAYDLAVHISGKSMKAISHFVFEHLATIDGVTSTATHFILKKYKENHRAFSVAPEQEERLLFV